MKIILVATASCLTLLPAAAQPKSLGASFSFTGLGLTYEHDYEEYKAFEEVSLKAETSEFILKRRDFPGMSIGVAWNFIIKEWSSSEGNTLRLFVGPGVTAGYTADYKSDAGVFFGLKGRVGGECEFSRNILISLCLLPTIGSHVTMPQGDLSMKYYKNGLIYSLVPEIGLKYRF